MSVFVDLEKRLKGDFHLKVAFEAENEILALLGASGCGKSMTLKCIAGIERPDRGRVVVDGVTLFDSEKHIDLTPQRRRTGLMFQNYALFPNMTVAQNIRAGARRERDKAKREALAERLMESFQLQPLAKHYPSQLSGGQQQRVALARAIVIKPDVLLMDEPLSNLDAKLRIEMRNAIRQIQNSVGITTIYVTHDQEEAMAVSDRIAVMSGGVIQHVSTPKSIYQRPANQFVANFIGRSNTLRAVYGKGTLRFGNGYVMPYDNCENVPAEDVLVAVRPEEFVLAADGQQGIDATVTSSVFLGLNTTYFVELYDGTSAEIVEESSISSIIPNGTKVKLTLKADKINVFTADGSTNLTKGVVNDVR